MFCFCIRPRWLYEIFGLQLTFCIIFFCKSFEIQRIQRVEHLYTYIARAIFSISDAYMRVKNSPPSPSHSTFRPGPNLHFKLLEYSLFRVLCNNQIKTKNKQFESKIKKKRNEPHSFHSEHLLNFFQMFFFLVLSFPIIPFFPPNIHVWTWTVDTYMCKPDGE